MTIKEFDMFVRTTLKRRLDLMGVKSADYAGGGDKLANFKLAGQTDGISAIEALRGMHLKHRVSIQQGLDDLVRDVVRKKEWWQEKLDDDGNYNLLLAALLEELHFTPDIDADAIERSCGKCQHQDRPHTSRPCNDGCVGVKQHKNWEAKK